MNKHRFFKSQSNLYMKCQNKDDIEFRLAERLAESTENTERRKTSFPKEKVQNKSLYKPVLNKKIMTTRE